MSINLNVAPESTRYSGLNVSQPGSGDTADGDLLSRILEASAKISNLSYVTNENLEVLEHLGTGRDLIVCGSSQFATTTCVALPAAAQFGLVVVLTPSLGHTKKVLRQLKILSLTARSFDLAPTKVEKRAIWEELDQNQVQVLVVTPGRLKSRRFCERLKARSVPLIVIDQAQWMSPWSHRYLPSYRRAGAAISAIAQNSPVKSQIVAMAWVSQGRINSDLVKLLRLQNPYYGKLIGATSERLDPQSVLLNHESERPGALLQEIHKTSGQGVIYCNSLKHFFDTCQILEKLGESFGAVKPGIDEFSLTKVLSDFREGQTRFVVSIGPLISEFTQIHDLETIIFNGMPESLEWIHCELLPLDGSVYQRCSVIVGEKDYYQHRFLIDKNYPDSLILRSCINGIRDVFGRCSGVSKDSLASHLKMALSYPPEEIDYCLQVLYREGIIHEAAELSEDGAHLVSLHFTAEEEANFWHEYPLRKIDHVARLNRMRDFVSKGHQGTMAQNLRHQL